MGDLSALSDLDGAQKVSDPETGRGFPNTHLESGDGGTSSLSSLSCRPPPTEHLEQGRRPNPIEAKTACEIRSPHCGMKGPALVLNAKARHRRPAPARVSAVCVNVERPESVRVRPLPLPSSATLSSGH